MRTARARYGAHVRGLTADTVPTETSEDVRVRVMEAARHSTLLFVVGPPGTGKSFATARAAELVAGDQLHPVEVTWIEFSRSVRELALLCELYEQLTGADAPSRPNARRLRHAIAEEFAQRPRLLILDEAQHIARSALLELRWFFDHPDAQFGLVAVGTPRLWDRLAPELRSRVAAKVSFSRLHTDEVVAFLTALDPRYGRAEPKVLRRLNDTHARGEIRWWALFTSYAQRYGPALDDDGLGEDLVEAILEALPT